MKTNHISEVSHPSPGILSHKATGSLSPPKPGSEAWKRDILCTLLSLQQEGKKQEGKIPTRERTRWPWERLIGKPGDESVKCWRVQPIHPGVGHTTFQSKVPGGNSYTCQTVLCAWREFVLFEGLGLINDSEEKKKMPMGETEHPLSSGITKLIEERKCNRGLG